jgi:hypothetical protein
MKLFSATLHDDARIWYEGLPDKGIKTMDQFEETFLNKWSLHKRFPDLDILGYPNTFPLGLVDNCPKFDGNPSLASPHAMKFLDYVLETKVRHQDVLIRLFLLSLGIEQREWVKHILSPKSITSLNIFIRKFLERWVIRIWTRGQNFAQKSKFSELPQNQRVRRPRCHEPSATRLGSNEHRMSEISRSVRIIKHAKKKCADCTVRTDANVAEAVR